METYFSRILINHLEFNFKANWIDTYVNNNDVIKRKNRKKIRRRIRKLLNLTIETFYKSLLSGEYVLRYSKIIEDINKLQEISDNIFEIFVNDHDSQEFILKTLKQRYIDILKIYSNLYKNFIKLVQSQNENPNIDIVYESNSESSTFFRETPEEYRENITFFFHILHIYRIDHFFTDKILIYRILNQLENEIKEYQYSQYYIAIKEKLLFLKFKWEIRQKSYKVNPFRTLKACIIDDELFLSTDDIKYSPSSKKLKNWKEYIQFYYELGDWENKISRTTNDFKHENYKNLTVLELIFLLKYYKDVKKNSDNLKKIVKQFEKRYNKRGDSVERFVYNKTYLYALNNLFSFIIENEPDDESQINRLKKKIEEIQGKCNIDNFFIESKHIKYKLNLLENKFESREVFKDSSEEKEELDKLTEEVNLYREKLKWSKDNHNLLFQLPYEECYVDSNIKDLKIFYSSSIALPLLHEESDFNYDKISNKLKELKHRILSVSSLKNEFDKIQEFDRDISDVKKELQNNQIKTIELIGVFTAVIAFIFTSISSFSFVKEFYQALLFTGIIGSCLLIMVAALFLFTRGIKAFNTWGLILTSIFLFVFSICSLNNSIDKLEKKINGIYLKKIDSLSIENKVKDSVISQFKKPPHIKQGGIPQLKNQE